MRGMHTQYGFCNCVIRFNIGKAVADINTSITSREAILAACTDLVAEKGLDAVNMRSVAARCGVAVGSVYNYFPSKADLLAAAIQAVWQEIFDTTREDAPPDGFAARVAWLFARVRAGAGRYPNFFSSHSITLAREGRGKAKEKMQSYFAYMRRELLAAVQADKRVRETAFSPAFTQEAFVDFVFQSLLSMLMSGAQTPDVLIEMIKRAIY